jgi:glucokinase
MKVLAGDIGGTNTRLVYADRDDSNWHIQVEKNYPSAEHSGLVEIINIFLSENDIKIPVNAACFAVAGPVKSGTSKITNLPWLINEKQLGYELNIPNLELINDFTAVAYGIAKLDVEDTLTLQTGIVNNSDKKNPDAVIIGAGTGLGVSHRVWFDGQYHILPSEAGHTGFSPENEQQCQLLSWLQKQHKHVSLEMLLSGNGLYTIYRFLRDESNISESAVVNEALYKADPAQIITEYALSGNDELCEKTLDCFIDIYGAAAGNVALHYYPVDELYIAGGIAPKIKEKMLSQGFLEAFQNKGLMSSNMKKITIKLILEDRVGLYGALSNVKIL